MNPQALWRAFSPMGEPPVTIVRASGCQVTADDGVDYLDAVAGLWYCNIGHGRREVAEALRDQILQLDHYPSFGDYQNDVAAELAERLAELSPFAAAKVLFQSGGSDGIESAVKLARQHWVLQGRPEKTLIVSREHGYHGVHGFGTALGGIPRNRAGWGPLDAGSLQVPWDSPDAFRAVIGEHGADRIAAFVAEPVIGSGGVLAPPDDYFPQVRALCDAHDILLVSDAVISGFGRLGNWFGMERWNVVPDIIVSAKGLTSGYVPLSAVIAGERVWRPYYEAGGSAFLHGNTYTGHAAACRAASLTIDIIERENLLERALAIESDLHAWLAATAPALPAVAEVRAGVGAMAAVELAPGLLEAEPDAPRRIARWIRRHHRVIVRPIPRALAIAPPLTITSGELRTAVEALLSGLDHAIPR
jgi:adenosylmethionine-8-amino-7-oxononanoate aminotransferase